MIEYFVDGIIVVEGKEDASYLSSFIKSEYVTTNGLDVPIQTINYLKNASKDRRVIILTDPDEAGQTIRNKLLNNVSNCISKSVDINKCHGKKRGVAECEKDEIKLVLHDYLEKFEENCQNNISESFLFKVNLIGDGSKENRFNLCKTLNIGNCNGKKLVERLNNLKLNETDILKILEKQNYGNQ